MEDACPMAKYITINFINWIHVSTHRGILKSEATCEDKVRSCGKREACDLSIKVR